MIAETCPDIKSAMHAARELAVSIIPIDHRTKRPAMDLLPRGDGGKPTWAPFQKQIADDATVDRWAKRCRAFAVVGGKVSGDVLAIDFDTARFWEAWREAVGDLLDGLPYQRTGRDGGGFHVYLTCDEPVTETLAWVPDESEQSGRRCAIETKGEGGYAILPPSLHPSGNRYTWQRGDLSSIPRVSAARLAAMLDAARRLDEMPQTRQQLQQAAKAPVKRREANRDGHGDIIGKFNAAVPIRDMLRRAGYTPRGERFVRPGGKSASVVVLDESRSFHFSSNDPLNDRHSHDAFDLLTQSEHGGDVRAAVKRAARELGIADAPSMDGSGAPAPAGRDRARAALKKLLGIDVARVLKYGRVDGEFELELADGRRVPIGPVSDLHKPTVVQDRIGDVTGRVIKTRRRDRWLSLVVPHFYVLQDVVSEGPAPGQWLIDELSELVGRERVEDLAEWCKDRGTDTDNAEALHSKLSLGCGSWWSRNGCLYVKAGALARHVSRAGFRHTAQQVGRVLARFGFEYRQVSARHKDKVAKGRYWVSPTGFDPAEVSPCPHK